ncbi:hypothetical protein [Nesterenkonia ebinurensis]|uniref:hypothetical protein n=1 Tax=Nesterenkonia ebinurensis TaxID=2608252 RepID=UPI00123E030A|nr:hypothetical protein [Nesterenkonia ebinurensis]
MIRLLELLARLPGTLLPFAVGLSLVRADFWTALGIGTAAVAGHFLAIPLARLLLRWVRARNLLLCQAVLYVILLVVLIAAVEQQMLVLVFVLSLSAALAAPAEGVCSRNPRLDRSAVGLSFLLAVTCGLLAAWTVPLVVCGVAAAAAVPVLVMLRSSGPEQGEAEVSPSGS